MPWEAFGYLFNGGVLETTRSLPFVEINVIVASFIIRKHSIVLHVLLRYVLFFYLLIQSTFKFFALEGWVEINGEDYEKE